MLQVLAWWVVIQIFGMAALPLTARLLRWLPDRGYAFSKAVGLLLVSYLLWLGASTGIWSNTPAGIAISGLLVAAISTWTLLHRGWENAKAQAGSFWRENTHRILVIEALFLLAFTTWAALRAYAPDKIIPAGGEKYMEIAFLNGVLNSRHFPPLDPWLAGYTISYYYFGYVMMGVMVQSTGVLPTVGFDLYDALTFALSAICAYGVVANLVLAHGANRLRRTAAAAGLLGALFVTGLGNQEGWIHALYSADLLPQKALAWISIPGLAQDPKGGAFSLPTWFWWRASRVLDDRDLFNQPLQGLQPITEFPFFSFLLGDNHPHKMALPFTLVAAGLAFNLLLKQSRPDQNDKVEDSPDSPSPGGGRAWIARLANLRPDLCLYLFYAVLLGGLAFLNTWDFPIYLVLCLLAFAAGDLLRRGQFAAAMLWRTAGLGAGLGVSAVLLYLFFYRSFSSQAGGVLPYVFPPTRLAQYLIQFAPLIFILAFLLVLAARGTSTLGFPWRTTLRAWAWIAGVVYGAYLLALIVGSAAMEILLKQGGVGFLSRWMGNLSIGGAVERTLLSRAADPWLFLLLSGLLALALTAVLRSINQRAAGSPATLFAALLAFVGLGLTFFVEFFYLRDNFGVRINTVFKFYFQGWALMACASAYGVWWVHSRAGVRTRAAFTAGSALLVAGGLVYPLLAIPNRAENFRYPPYLDAAATFAGTIPNRWAAQPDDWAAIQWLRKTVSAENGSSVPVILEATTGGYDNAGRVSAFTGFPTLLGWSGHEQQWRGSSREIDLREPIIRAIYTTPTGSTALDLLHQWKVKYLILGDAERRYINQVCSNPQTPCDPALAAGKFNQILRPVFTQGSATIYSVP